MIDCDKIKKLVDKIPDEIILDLWNIGQEHDYASIRGEREWNEEDEFWRQISYAGRERGCVVSEFL